MSRTLLSPNCVYVMMGMFSWNCMEPGCPFTAAVALAAVWSSDLTALAGLVSAALVI